MFQEQESKIMLQTNTLVTGTTSSDLDSTSMTDLVQHISLQQASVLWLCLNSVYVKPPTSICHLVSIN